MKLHRAFTIVELIVIMAVIAILAGVTAVGYSGMQRNARESERESDTAIIKMSLEEFYEKNGRYPSTSEMTGDDDETLNFLTRELNIPETALVSPLAPEGTVNSIVDMSAHPHLSIEDTSALLTTSYGYLAHHDDDSHCITQGEDCVKFHLGYMKEGSPDISSFVELKSRYGH